jgi:hypothetical protein
MIIEVIDSTESNNHNNNSNESTCTTIEELVNQSMERLVEHYRQPIHQQLDDDETTVTESLPPVVKFLVEQLEMRSSKEEEEEEDNDCLVVLVVRSLLCAYQDHIRPVLFLPNNNGNNDNKVDASGIAVLFYYDMMVHHILAAHIPTILEKSNIRRRRATHHLKTLEESLMALIQDITLATAEPVHENVLLALIRLLTHGLTVAHAIIQSSSPKAKLDRSTYCLLVTTLLSFGPLPLDDDKLVQQHLYQLNAYLSTPFAHDEIRIEPLSSLEIDNTGSWNTSPIQERIEQVWKSPFWECVLTTTNNEDNSETTIHESLSTRQSAILQCFSLNELVQSMRSHFFGHDMPVPQSSPVQTTRLFMGSTQPYTLPSEQQVKPYVAIPSRVHAVWQLLFRLPCLLMLMSSSTCCSSSNSDNRMIDSIWNDLAPMLYELLDAASERINGVTCLALFCVLHQTTRSSSSSSSSHSFPLGCNLIFGNFLKILNRVVKTCRQGSVLAHAGLVQRELLLQIQSSDDSVGDNTNNNNDNNMLELQLQTTKTWLEVLEIVRHRRSETELATGTLLSILLLLDTWKMDDTATIIIDLGRPLLQSILPLIQLDCSDQDWLSDMELRQQERTQVVALVVLSKTVFLTYPIVCRHVHKLLCTCLAMACQYYSRQEQQQKKKQDSSTNSQSLLCSLSIHTASVVLLLTDAAGQTLLETLKDSDNKKYQEVLSTVIESIQKEAHSIRMHNNNNS